jgi:hypothetical protein
VHDRPATLRHKTGEVTPLPESVLNSISGPAPNVDPDEFKLNSRLLMVNTDEDPLADNPKVRTYCFELRDNLGHDNLVEIGCPRAPQ